MHVLYVNTCTCMLCPSYILLLLYNVVWSRKACHVTMCEQLAGLSYCIQLQLWSGLKQALLCYIHFTSQICSSDNITICSVHNVVATVHSRRQTAVIVTGPCGGIAWSMPRACPTSDPYRHFALTLYLYRHVRVHTRMWVATCVTLSCTWSGKWICNCIHILCIDLFVYTYMYMCMTCVCKHIKHVRVDKEYASLNITILFSRDKLP